MTRTPAEIDAFLAAPKCLFGPLEWLDKGSTAKLGSALFDDQGAVIGGATLVSTANVETPVQRGDAVLLLDGLVVQRLAVRPRGFHVNPTAHPIPAELRGLRCEPEHTRLYAWADNRHWPRDPRRTLAARPLAREPNSMGAAFNLFLAECGIEATLPEAPWRPKLEFPS